jgi:hypothetical protein
MANSWNKKDYHLAINYYSNKLKVFFFNLATIEK